MDQVDAPAAHAIIAQNLVHFSGLTLLLYDWLLTLPNEVEHIWKRWRKLSGALYLLNRYFAVAASFMLLIETFRVSSSSCLVIKYIREYTMVIGGILCGLLLLLRTYALYGGQRPILILLVVIAAILIAAACLFLAVAPKGGNVDLSVTNLGCHSGITQSAAPYFAAPWEASLIWDLVVFGMTMYRTWYTMRTEGTPRSTRARERHSLLGLMWRDGLFYFLSMTLLNIANILVLYFSSEYYKGTLTTLAGLLSVNLVSRLMLHLYTRPTRLPPRRMSTPSDGIYVSLSSPYGSPSASGSSLSASPSFSGSSMPSTPDEDTGRHATLGHSHSEQNSHLLPPEPRYGYGWTHRGGFGYTGRGGVGGSREESPYRMYGGEGSGDESGPDADVPEDSWGTGKMASLGHPTPSTSRSTLVPKGDVDGFDADFDAEASGWGASADGSGVGSGDTGQLATDGHGGSPPSGGGFPLPGVASASRGRRFARPRPVSQSQSLSRSMDTGRRAVTGHGAPSQASVNTFGHQYPPQSPIQLVASPDPIPGITTPTPSGASGRATDGHSRSLEDGDGVPPDVTTSSGGMTDMSTSWGKDVAHALKTTFRSHR